MTKIRLFFQNQGKGLSLIIALGIGMLIPKAAVLSDWMKYLLMVMLFFSFLGLDFKLHNFPKSVFFILLANIAIAFISYVVLAPFQLTLALAAFMTAIAPTSIVAPVIIGFLQGKVEYVFASVLFTNLANAVIVPLALPFMLGKVVQISVWEVLQPVCVVMIVPLLLALLVSRLPVSTQALIAKGKAFTFPAWLVNLTIIGAKTSSFLHNEAADSARMLFPIGLISLVICVINFSVGALLGGRHHLKEARVSLGQKNLTFVIWIAITFINPLVAMGPTFYILYHHIYNSWLIYRFEKQKGE